VRVAKSEGSTPTADGLKQIWERVFQRAPIGLSDDFHDLGGNAVLADRICSEIFHTYNRSVPGVAISHAPSISKLALLLQQDPLPAFSPLIQIKTGTDEPPVFIAHGLSGMVEYHTLAKHIHTSNSIIGFQAVGLDGREEPLERVEDMAGHYLNALLKRQPDGPYFLIGYSFGGLVAFEMAQKLLAKGKQIALLALVDAYPHPRFMLPAQRFRVFVKRMRTHAGKMSGMPTSNAASYFVRGIKRRLHLAAPLEIGTHPEPHNFSLAATLPWVNQKTYRAYANYEPKFYPGSIQFITAKVQTFFPGNPGSVWKRLARDFEVETIPGDHLGIITSEYRPLAEVLTRFIRKASTNS